MTFFINNYSKKRFYLQKQADKAMSAARALERATLAKVQVLQKHARDLRSRENRLSNEKLEMSKERLGMEQMIKNFQNNRCSLCKIGVKSNEVIVTTLGEIGTSNQSDTLFRDSIDLDIEASLEKLRSTNYSLDDIHLEDNFIDTNELDLFKLDL